ncbi:uncharacterized protein LOC115096668 [Rhinatrema bivittatum]|uniref:uncharacterized protein LOC115096668 n=1 Tax=Rhinatrema bivittatum TaxID=194408 RepID=UPI00112D04B6|nr:uncharacterized protein LOC115096668 [Rhinatrema bivittatum]
MSSRKKPLDFKKYSYHKLALPEDSLGDNMAAGSVDAAESPGEIAEDPLDSSELPTRADMKRWFADLKHELAANTADLRASIEDIKGDLAENGRRLFEVETRAEANSEEVKVNRENITIIQSEVERLLEKVEDLENRSCRNNLRFRGVPELVDYADCGAVVKQICAMLLTAGEPDQPSHEAVEVHLVRAHRVLGPRINNLPKDIIACFQDYVLKEKIAGIARRQNKWQWQGHEIMIFIDLSPVTIKKRRDFKPVTELLRREEIHYRWLFPFGLSFSVKGAAHRVKTPTEASQVLQAVGFGALAELPAASKPPMRKDDPPRWQRVNRGDKRLRRHPDQGPQG